MELFYATLIFLIGLGVLISGAEIFIHHSAQLGAKLGISDVIVGITLVALGTSIPEIFVSVSSIINDAPALALGNSIGSNISNIAIILWVKSFLVSFQNTKHKSEKYFYFDLERPHCGLGSL